MLSTLSRHNLAIAGQQCQSTRSPRQLYSQRRSMSLVTDRWCYRQLTRPHSASPGTAAGRTTATCTTTIPQSSERRQSTSSCESPDIRTNGTTTSTLPRRSQDPVDEPSWSELLSRRWAVRFRSRRAVSHSKSQQHLSTSTLHRRLVAQYNICRSRDAETAARIIAVFFCWYFGRIEFLYGLFTGGGSRRSNVRLALAIGLVTALTILTAVSGVVTLRLVWTGLTLVVLSTLNFALLLVCVFAVTVATITFVSFE